MKNSLPRWQFSDLYSGFDGGDYARELAAMQSGTQQLLTQLKTDPGRGEAAEAWLKRNIALFNRVQDQYVDLYAYAYIRYSTKTTDAEAMQQISRLDEAGLPLRQAEVLFRNQLKEIETEIPELLSDPEIEAYRFFLEESLLLQKKQMAPEMEDLAADLNRAGGDAWSRMQGAISSTASKVWDTVSGEKKTVTQLRTLAHDPDREIRKKAYTLELDAWKDVQLPMAYALNGVKGSTSIVNQRRGYASSLEKSILQARISPKALDALIGSMEKALPMFRSYMQAKAKFLNLPVLSFYDLFAPVGKESRKWSFDESRAFIITQFGQFSDDLAGFAKKAFTGGWIDAEPREGKVGGAYCISFPIRKESRILCNFGGSFSDLTTVAHELGHGYHHHVLKDASAIHREYPMTLAETASIFAETIVFNSALDTCAPAEKISILDVYLQDAAQVIVDILSRYYFENAVFAERAKGDISPERYCEMMLDAQAKTYGEALNAEERHPYMWAVKGHYYIPDLSFYNFPYAFGQLFGLGLYARYQAEGAAFEKTYREILTATGRASAVEITKNVGCDIENTEFWDAGVSSIAEKTAQFIELAG